MTQASKLYPSKRLVLSRARKKDNMNLYKSQFDLTDYQDCIDMIKNTARFLDIQIDNPDVMFPADDPSLVHIRWVATVESKQVPNEKVKLGGNLVYTSKPEKAKFLSDLKRSAAFYMLMVQLQEFKYIQMALDAWAIDQRSLIPAVFTMQVMRDIGIAIQAMQSEGKSMPFLDTIINTVIKNLRDFTEPFLKQYYERAVNNIGKK